MKKALFLAAALLCVVTCHAQTDPTLETGLKPYGSYHGGDLDSVSLSNGNLTLHIPLASYPQRGSLGYTPRIMYNNKGWYVVPNCNSKTSICSPYWAWHGQGVTLDTSSENDIGVSWQPAYKGSFTLVFTAGTGDGSAHQLANNLNGGMSALDGTAIWYDGSAPANLQPGLTRDRRGYHKNGTSPLEDANGNLLIVSSSSVLDTLGRTFQTVYTSGADSSGCTGPLATAFAGTYSYPGFNGSTRQIKVCYASIRLQSNFQATGYYNSTEYPIAERAYTTNMIQSIVLFNGTSWSGSPAWTFEYSSRNPGDSTSVNYGDITRITLPLGGTLSYAWDMLPSCDFNSPTPMSRKVISRTLDANDGAGPRTWTYGGAVTDPDGNDTLHIFTALNNSCSYYETQTKYFQGSYLTGTLLKTVNTDYQWIASPFDALNPSSTLRTVTNVFPIRITTIWPSGKATKIEKVYDSNMFFSVPGGTWTSASYGNVTELREYDYGDGINWTLLRRTDYTYKAFDGSPNSSQYLAANLLDLVSSVTTYDGNGNQVAFTTYGYDEFGLQPSGVTTQRDTTLTGVRGNRTSESHWLNTTGGMVTSTTAYYDTGTPYQTTDPLGHTTTNFYGAGFQSTTDFAGAYVTQVQNALSQSEYFDYDFGTGLRTALKDLNSQITSWTYDFLNRTLLTTAPNGATTSWRYHDKIVGDPLPPSVTATTTVTTTPSVLYHISEGDVDGLGRLVQTMLLSDPEGTDFVDTTYDKLSRVSTVSNPHRSTPSPTDGITRTTYDALGRVTQVTLQDGSLSRTDYSQFPIVTVTDPAGNQRRSRTDALGRLVEVDELPSPGVTLVTVYTYDALGNLLRVDQKGTAPSDSTQWRTRLFTYNSLSQLLTAYNPESGTISYAYDNDGNLLMKTSPAPNQTGAATQTISYCYDALHRVTKKDYQPHTFSPPACPITAPVVNFTYDQGTNGIGHLTSLADQAGTANYVYDPMGRLSSETRTILGANNLPQSKTLGYDYNLDGSLKTLTYPSGAVISYTLSSAGTNTAGRVGSVTDGSHSINYVTGAGGPTTFASYGPDGSITGFTNGFATGFAGVTNTFSYNNRLQPINMSASSPSQTVFSIGYNFHWQNGDNGNVFGITNYKDANRSQTFTYDALNRLIHAENTGTDCSAKVLQNKTEYWGNDYVYDAWGNLLQKNVTKCSAENLQATADGHNWLHTTAGADYLYDGAGNMTSDPTDGVSATYDPENRIATATKGGVSTAYVYDSDGNRVKKATTPPPPASPIGTLYWYMTPGIVAESDLNGVTQSEYVFFNGERVARRDGLNGAGGVFYYFSDHLKTASVITDSTGTIKAESDYYPWGGELQFVNADSNHYKFTGKERDIETGLDYFGARYYSNGLGRWVSADWSATPVPVPYADLGDPQSLNLYSYVRNIPTSQVDVDGHDCPTACDTEVDMELAKQTLKQITPGVFKGLGKELAELGPAAPLAIPPAAAFVFAATVGPEFEPDLSCMGPYCDMYVYNGTQGQNQTQNGQTQETEQAVEPQVSTSGAGAGKKGGKPYHDTPENSARIAQNRPPIGKDGHPVELHSPDQTHTDQSQEMTRTQHRGKGNFKKNHTNTGQQPSKVNRNQAAKDRRAHWKKVHQDKTKKK